MEHILKKAVLRSNKRNVIRQLLLFARMKPKYQRRSHKYIKRVMNFGSQSQPDDPPPPPARPAGIWGGRGEERGDGEVFMVEVPDEAKIGQIVYVTIGGQRVGVKIPTGHKKGNVLHVSVNNKGNYVVKSLDLEAEGEIKTTLLTKNDVDIVPDMDRDWSIMTLRTTNPDGEFMAWIRGDVDNLKRGIYSPGLIKTLGAGGDIRQKMFPYIQKIGEIVPKITKETRGIVNLMKMDWVPYVQDSYSGWKHSTSGKLTINQLEAYLGTIGDPDSNFLGAKGILGDIVKKSRNETDRKRSHTLIILENLSVNKWHHVILYFLNNPHHDKHQDIATLPRRALKEHKIKFWVTMVLDELANDDSPWWWNILLADLKDNAAEIDKTIARLLSEKHPLVEAWKSEQRRAEVESDLIYEETMERMPHTRSLLEGEGSTKTTAGRRKNARLKRKKERERQEQEEREREVVKAQTFLARKFREKKIREKSRSTSPTEQLGESEAAMILKRMDVDKYRLVQLVSSALLKDPVLKDCVAIIDGGYAVEIHTSSNINPRDRYQTEDVDIKILMNESSKPMAYKIAKENLMTALQDAYKISSQFIEPRAPRATEYGWIIKLAKKGRVEGRDVIIPVMDVAIYDPAPENRTPSLLGEPISVEEMTSMFPEKGGEGKVAYEPIFSVKARTFIKSKEKLLEERNILKQAGSRVGMSHKIPSWDKQINALKVSLAR